MTVATSVNRAQFLGSGSAGPFTFNMRFFANTEITVIHVDEDDVETVLTEGIGYTLTGAGALNGGSVTLATALASGEALTVARTIELVQPTSIRNQGAFFPEIHEDTFDRLVMMMQQISGMAERAIKMPKSASGDFTVTSGDRAGMVLGFGAGGEPIPLPPSIASFILATPWINDIDFPTLALADAAAVAADKLLVVSSVWDIPVGATLNAAVKVLPGGGFSTGALNINGPFEGTDDCFRDGLSVVFGKGSVKGSVEAEWWCGRADGVTNSTAALNSAAAAHPDVALREGTYLTSDWTVGGHAKHIHGAGAAPTGLQVPSKRTVVKAIGAQASVLFVTGFNHSFEHITFNGADATIAVISLGLTHLGVKFRNCVAEHTLDDTGILVLIDTTNGGTIGSLQGDSNLFEDCAFWQDYLDGDRHCGVGLSIIGSNSFLNHIHRCKFWFCATPIKISFGAGAWIDDVQFHSWTGSAIVIAGNFQTTIIEKCYTESSAGLNFLTMTDLAVLTTATLTIRNNIINADNNLSLIPKQPIIMEANAFQGLTYINDPGVADFPKVISIGNSWQDAGSFTGAKYDSVIRINDTTNSGATAYNTFPVETTGTWTPVLTCATPGNLAVTHSNQVGTYTRQGNLVSASFVITTSAFTHTTASGNLQLTGLPFAGDPVANHTSYGALVFSGITKAGATNIVSRVLPATSYVSLAASGSGIANSSVTIADLPTGGAILLQGTITYSIQ